ncbi:hypothetical protein E2C01_038112 [Portunus trituberculatus]|uniref:Uncharacterized protein n=1 Tax=Portunus trituberculatus TaxID=210409 RepID=A0A5B7FGR4_PORTR|nr:hypothetical protein [Portunus trituberculatus]
MVQRNHACFGVRGVSKRTGSNPVHGPSVELCELVLVFAVFFFIFPGYFLLFYLYFPQPSCVFT